MLPLGLSPASSTAKSNSSRERPKVSWSNYQLGSFRPSSTPSQVWCVTAITAEFGAPPALSGLLPADGQHALTGRMAAAGGNQFRLKTNTGTVASGGAAQTPGVKNVRGAVAAQSVWANDNSAITPGATLATRLSIGFASTGGQGGWQASEPSEKFACMPNSTNPVDVEFTSIASQASVLFDATINFNEGC